MSNATHEPRNPGDNKRRRNRGGRNRNQNRNHDHNDRENSGNRNHSGGQRQGGQGGQRHGRQDTRPPRTYSAPKLSWWQKLLKAIGLYKEPVRPPRPERPIDPPRPEGLEIRGPKNNTRNLRNGDGEGDSSAPREDRPPRNREGRGDRDGRERRGERGERGERAPRGDRRGGDPTSVESTRVYVGNLSYDVTEEDLKDLFKGVGPVRSIEIVYNRTTHRSKGYGFVEMLHVDEAKRAVEVLHDQPFMGRNLTVSGAKSRGQDEREDQEDREARNKAPIQPVLAPLPAAAAAIAAAPIVETVTNLLDEPATAEPAAETEPVAQIEETQESSVDAQTVQDELPLVPTNTESCETGCGCSHNDEAPATESPTENP